MKPSKHSPWESENHQEQDRGAQDSFDFSHTRLPVKNPRVEKADSNIDGVAVAVL